MAVGTTNETLASEHERLGRAAVAWIADYTRTLDEQLVCSTATPRELERLFAEDLPQNGTPAAEIFEQFAARIATHAMHIPSPRYYGLFNPTPLPIAVWADALCSALNQNGAAWRNSPSASVVEARVLRWLCQLIGYDENSFGTLTSGGSEANLIALKCARDRACGRPGEARAHGLRRALRKDLVVYASELCHYSFDKSVDILGLGRDNLRFVPTDEKFHLNTAALAAEIERDLRADRQPLCIVGNAGATSNGAVDSLDALADVAREYDLWFHVDAAYGGALAFSPRHKHLLSGISRADSVTIDPHKWMFVPFGCGAVLVKGGGSVLRASFDITPAYLSEERGGEDVPYDFFRYGQLGTRRFNALKFWMALKHLGVNGYAEVIERQIALTAYLAARLRAAKDFTIVGEVETAVCCFQWTPADAPASDAATRDERQIKLQQRIERSGEAWISTTILRGRRTLRANVNSYLTEQRHIDDLIGLLERESKALLCKERER